MSSLQELCRRRLAKTRLLPQWKTMTQVLTECIGNRAYLFSLVCFSGCGVNFCMQRYFSESYHMAYWISCSLDRKWYIVVRIPYYNAERLPGDDNLWHWALVDHPHVLSILAVAANAPGIQAHMVILTPNDGLEHFAGILAVSDLCIHELHLWKSLHLLCSALIYLRGQGLTARPFEFFNVYLGRTDLGLNNALVWNRRPFKITSQPGSLWSLLLRLHGGFAVVYAVISTTEHAATNFSVAVVVANSADTADTISRRRQSTSGCLQVVHCTYGKERVLSPCSYAQQLVSTLAEMFRTPQRDLHSIHDSADMMYASTAPIVAPC